MTKRYETGTKRTVLLQMLESAIGYEQGLMDAYAPQFGEQTSEGAKVVEDCEARIRDYKRLVSKTS